jgi:hypothetical protein
MITCGMCILLGNGNDVFRDFESLDYDSLLAAGPKKGRAKRRGDKRIEQSPDSDDMQMTDDADDCTDEELEGSDRQAATEAELLPTEDTFLRLADMEAFVQVLHS